MVANDAARVDPRSARQLAVHHIIREGRPDGGVHESEPNGEVMVITGSEGVVSAERAIEDRLEILKVFTGPHRWRRSHVRPTPENCAGVVTTSRPDINDDLAGISWARDEIEQVTVEHRTTESNLSTTR